MSISRGHAPRQDGIVLPVVLILLLVLTIASLLIIEQISSQTRMATNAAVSQIALQAAESELTGVISGLNSGTISSAPSAYYGNTGGKYFFNASNYGSSNPLPWKSNANWTALTSSTTLCSASVPAVSECKYMIEMLPSVRAKGGSVVRVFRITARVVGPGNHGVVMLQALYQKP
ncbi:MAG TPA: PilX N-terminal domain-containing pilus assembly protein [Frateuria sp.]|uniref:pilus assembly PilX family protein n=1 Tax=Frateuria sp. TaxID=2211372 RepID=UPI002DF6BC01|nr:PilX N-terminal domain-containing pilus assembly protein [Frateuria sp.]